MPSDDLSSRKGGDGGGSNKKEEQSFWKEWSHSASFQAALTTVVGLGMVFAGGVGYLEWYKAHVLHRVRLLFVLLEPKLTCTDGASLRRWICESNTLMLSDKIGPSAGNQLCK